MPHKRRSGKYSKIQKQFYRFDENGTPLGCPVNEKLSIETASPMLWADFQRQIPFGKVVFRKVNHHYMAYTRSGNLNIRLNESKYLSLFGTNSKTHLNPKMWFNNESVLRLHLN
jgi:hypothetical protein